MTDTNFIGQLGAGSGINVRELAESLVAAERAPREQIIERSRERAEARISGYGALRFALSQIQDAFRGLNDLRDFNALSVANSQPAAFTVAANATAAPGSHSIEVQALARPQRSVTDGFSSATASLNGGNAFTLQLDVAGEAHTLTVVPPTPQRLVETINGAGLGLSASLVDTGVSPDPIRLVVTGQEGAAQDFTIQATGFQGEQDSPPAAPPVAFTTTQTAGDAELRVNGLDIRRGSNTIEEVIPGVTLELSGVSSGPATISLARDVGDIRSRVERLVEAYQDFAEVTDVLLDRDSDIEEFGGALAGDSLVNRIRAQVRGFITNMSSTAGDTIAAGRDVGLGFDRNGRIQLDTERLQSALESNFDEVVQMFSAGTNDQSVFSGTAGGLAGDAVSQIDRLLRRTGLIENQVQSANREMDRAQRDLERLEERMEGLLARYMRQFTVMETLVGQSNSLRENLASTFEGLMATYTNRR